MLYAAILLFATGYLCHLAYKLGMRSDVWSVVLAPLLMLAAWSVLLAPTVRQGEGAAAGVVVVQAAIWAFGALCALLALILLGASVYARRSALAIGVLLFVVGPAVLVLGYRLLNPRVAESIARGTPSEGVGVPRRRYNARGADSTAGGTSSQDTAWPREAHLEGYSWALDNGIDSESACAPGSPAFIEGCKKAVQQRQRATGAHD